MRYLSVLESSSGGSKVRIFGPSESLPKKYEDDRVRVSPIFPVLDGAQISEHFEGYVGFAFPQNSYLFITKHTREERAQLWFSHGLASVIYFSEDKAALLEKLKAHQNHDLVAWEIWEIGAQGNLQEQLHWVRKPTHSNLSLDVGKFPAVDENILFSKLRTLFREFGRVASIYTPEIYLSLVHLRDSVEKKASELSSLAVEGSGNAEEDPAEINDTFQRINQILSYLIQLESGMEEAVMQLSAGAVPILRNNSYVANYSLLGIGGAYRALCALEGYTEVAFEKFSIPSAIQKAFSESEPFDVFTKINMYTPDDWRRASNKIDLLLQDKFVKSSPKVAHFSTTIGFSSNGYCVTAASQVIAAADSMRWSPLTLTHELLHAHVASILGVVFSRDVEQGLDEKSFSKFNSDFMAFVGGDVSRAPRSRLESIRFAIFNFAIARQAALKKAHDLRPSDTKAKIRMSVPPGAEEFRGIFNNSLRLLEEILVHTLDIRYFYYGDRDVFVEFIWRSWMAIPAVIDDMETYILRSLVASASLLEGSVADRLRQAHSHLKDILTRLIKEEGNPFFKRALQVLTGTNERKRMNLLIYPTLYIADVASNFLYSSKVESEIWTPDDNQADGNEGTRRIPQYDLKDCAFSGALVGNPIAFLADRLRRLCSPSGELIEEDRRSCWLLLVLSSKK